MTYIHAIFMTHKLGLRNSYAILTLNPNPTLTVYFKSSINWPIIPLKIPDGGEKNR